MVLALALALAVCVPQETRGDDDNTLITIPVGVAAWSREVVLPGSLLRATSATIRTSVILRIDSVSPHGTDFRYDLEYYGLDPGTYDLTAFMERADGTSSTGLPALTVRVTSALPPGQIMPHPVRTGPLPSVGGYRSFLWLFGGLWLSGALLLVCGRRGRSLAQAAAETARVPSLADRLTPLVEQARVGSLSRAGRAELELMLIAFWRSRLGLETTSAAEALSVLKDHADAGPLLRQVEFWLHSPGSPPDVDVADLLAPYRDLPAGDEVDAG